MGKKAKRLRRKRISTENNPPRKEPPVHIIHTGNSIPLMTRCGRIGVGVKKFVSESIALNHEVLGILLDVGYGEDWCDTCRRSFLKHIKEDQERMIREAGAKES
jgi:hypothetical protein